MFKKVLIANRGAIACRIMRTLRRLNVASIAVYTEADHLSRHVDESDEAYCIGNGAVAESYLDANKILAIAMQARAEAIHPGYGFLSENPNFAEACAQQGIRFIGPTPEQIRIFGLKHTARSIAQQNQVPLLPGTDLLSDVEAACRQAQTIGYPVMLKSTAGGGGIGMRLCANEAELITHYETVKKLAASHFKESGLFLEKYIAQARHIEVQIFGDGKGGVIALGERDCSLQRRNQKVVEETPAPNLLPAIRTALLNTAVKLGQAIHYESAGTVEYIFDTQTQQFYFLEVNTRLQVEHGITEAVTGVDLVEWMVKQAAGELPPLSTFTIKPQGVAIQARIYAENAAKNFQPCCGTLTTVKFPQSCRVETWVENGTELSAFYDPMIAKMIVHAPTRGAAVTNLLAALNETTLYGIETNLSYLKQIISSAVFQTGQVSTQFLGQFAYLANTLDVFDPGTQTTVQDYPGRLGYWNVGVPPSGPMDSLAFRLANRLVNNPEHLAGLEITLNGPTLRFNCASVIALCGAPIEALLDNEPLALWQSHAVHAGALLKIGKIDSVGSRVYLAVQGGIQVPHYLGSRSTFMLGQFGGHAGRTLQSGDVLSILPAKPFIAQKLREAIIPRYTNDWEIFVLYGPHGAPDFFTQADIEQFFATAWKVHHHSSRTGVRLIGPKPQWARPDGGEAGLHPSNIHDNAYAIGAIDFTGDMPIILGPDGPSLGGFVCPATIITAELWKIGQLRPGDRIRFRPLSLENAQMLETQQNRVIQNLDHAQPAATSSIADYLGQPILQQFPEQAHQVQVTYRQAGDKYLLVEYGPPILDLNLRFRIHALMTLIETQAQGIIDLTPGIRSLQIHFDTHIRTRDELLAWLMACESRLPALDDMNIPSRIIHLPLSWDDPATQVAIEKYNRVVRPAAPWYPSNIEFIRRINGLDHVDDVKQIVFDASYLVMGLGDVYLGAPVATPLDPRHRLVTTKYNPARTWTPENAVGIGGAYLCIYGMEGPGGYQLVGRTLQMWNRYRQTEAFKAHQPWLLRYFDQIRFYPVSETELLKLRADFIAGRFKLRIEESTLNLKQYNAFLQQHRESIESFKTQQQKAFDEESQRWKATAAFETINDDILEAADAQIEIDLPADAEIITAPVSGTIWKLLTEAGQQINQQETILVIESMKMEFPVPAPASGVVLQLFCQPGNYVAVGQALCVIRHDK